MIVFLIANNAWRKINAGVNVKNWFIKVVWNKGSAWNPSHCERECGKSCDVGEYLDYEDCRCWKQLVDKLVEECTETVKEMKLAKITSAEDENKHKFCSCTVYIVLFSITFTINVGIGTYFVYYKHMNRNKETGAK